jgi:hypothetical protein
MRSVVIVRASALLGFAVLLSACPKKDADAVPEPAATATTAQPSGASDKAGAEAPAVAAPAAAPPAADPAASGEAHHHEHKKKEDPGGW